MSVWVYIENASGETLPAPEAHQEGGTIQVGGCDVCELNVTYNYSSLFQLAAGYLAYIAETSQDPNAAYPPITELDSIARNGLWRWLRLNAEEGATLPLACDVAPVLEALADVLQHPQRASAARQHDYWAPTPDNAAVPLRLLARWCRIHPQGRIRCSG